MSVDLSQLDMSITGLRKLYSDGDLTPAALMEAIREKAGSLESHNIYIHLLSAEQCQPFLDSLANKNPEETPLWGIPFTLKDNIDLADIPTTAACEAFTYTPGCRNSFDPDYVSGGSSAGSAVSVACGLSSFSLGTDTAGSGRVPAGFNNLIGLKPSRGLVPATGVVPACQSLDCVSIFSFNSDDANLVLGVAEGFDDEDPYSRDNVFDNKVQTYGCHEGDLKVAVLKEKDLRFFGDDTYRKAYQDTLATLEWHYFYMKDPGFLNVTLLLHH